jgi:hypothetical protein
VDSVQSYKDTNHNLQITTTFNAYIGLTHNTLKCKLPVHSDMGNKFKLPENCVIHGCLNIELYLDVTHVSIQMDNIEMCCGKIDNNYIIKGMCTRYNLNIF